MPQTIISTSPLPSRTVSNPTRSIPVDKTLSSAANLVKLLPSGTLLFFHYFHGSFTNHGNCNNVNKYLTGFLMGLCTLSCIFFSFTDSFVSSNGKLYYGIATFNSFYIFNKDVDNTEEENVTNVTGDQPRRYRIRVVDVIHAAFAALFFLSLALSGSDVQKCFIPANYLDTFKQFFRNLTFGVGLLSGVVFFIFPTSRKGIGYSEMSHQLLQ